MSKKTTSEIVKSDDSYFSTIHQSNNEVCDYNFEPPLYGPSNTDQSFYEPQYTRIANMRKSASGLSTGAYDFEGDKNIDPAKIDISDYHVPFGRKPGVTFEEVSQVQRINAEELKLESDTIENAENKKKSDLKEMIDNSVTIANAISNGSGDSE